MKHNGSQYRNLILISQISICVMVPTFLCLALGIWLDKKFGLWTTVPLLLLGIAAGARSAYILATDTIRMDEHARKKAQEDHIQELLEKEKKSEKDIKKQ